MMAAATPSRLTAGCRRLWICVLFVLPLVIVSSFPLAAQIHGIPPSVTSIQNHLPPYLPNAPASVTSVGPHGYVGPPAFPVYPRYPRTSPGRYGVGHGSRIGYANFGYYGYGGGYLVPFYVPYVDSSYGDDVGGGPYVYSGPPEQTLHVVVDIPPARRKADMSEDEDAVQTAKSAPPAQSEILPLDETILVFRDGRRQEVTNYAVMGQTLYVFDGPKRKIPLQELDVPATIKANDDRGVDFRLPISTQS